MSTFASVLTDSDQNIVLTGFMGTGKSTVGRRLAQHLNFEFTDTDQLIEAHHGPIADLFATRGESHFRDLEREIAASVAGSRRHVVATGGGTLLDRATEETLGASGRVFCLHASMGHIAERVTNSRSPVRRPLLETTDVEARARELYEQRKAGYRRFPMVTTGTRDIEDVVADLELLAATAPSVSDDGAVVVGIGIAARARRYGHDRDATVIDVGRIQPASGLDAETLIGMQQDVIARLAHVRTGP